jgi:hypothetical protein
MLHRLATFSRTVSTFASWDFTDTLPAAIVAIVHAIVELRRCRLGVGLLDILEQPF